MDGRVDIECFDDLLNVCLVLFCGFGEVFDYLFVLILGSFSGGWISV